MEGRHVGLDFYDLLIEALKMPRTGFMSETVMCLRCRGRASCEVVCGESLERHASRFLPGVTQSN